MSIELALKQYIETQEVAEKDLNGIPSATRPGWEGTKREAQQNLPGLFSKLERELENETTVIGLAGDVQSVKDFTDIADQRPDTIVVNRDALYATIAERVEPLLGGSKQFGPSQFNFMVKIFRGVVADLGLTLRTSPQFKDVVVANDAHELTGIIRQSIEDSIGDALVVKFLRNEITKRAVEKKVSGEKVFVVVVDGDPQTMGALGSKSIALKVSPPVSGENVAEVFEKLLGNGKSETIEQQPQNKKTKKQYAKKEEKEE